LQAFHRDAGNRRSIRCTADPAKADKRLMNSSRRSESALYTAAYRITRLHLLRVHRREQGRVVARQLRTFALAGGSDALRLVTPILKNIEGTPALMNSE
jgi:hypothetical protein